MKKSDGQLFMVKILKSQRGAVLPMALILLTIMALLGASAVLTSNTRAQMVTNQMRYAQLEHAAENVLSRRIHNYPDNIEGDLSALNLSDANIGITDSHNACIAVQRTNKVASGGSGVTPGEITFGHGGSYHKITNDAFTETKFYHNGDGIWDGNKKHPHLHSDNGWQDSLAEGDSPEIVSMYLDGDIKIVNCSGGFANNKGGRIFYTGSNVSTCGWPSYVEGYQVTQAQMNSAGFISGVLNGGSTGVGFINIADVYKISELTVTARDDLSGAEVSLTMGMKSHKPDEDLDALNSSCIPDKYATVEDFRQSEGLNDEILNEVGDFRALYIYQNIAN